MTQHNINIVAFLCTWCAYGGADRAGVGRHQVPDGIRVVRVPCSGAVEPELVLNAFASGAAGVMILACHPGDCHYIDGNRRALQRHLFLDRLLGQFGIDRERLSFDYVSSSEGKRFAELTNSMMERITRLETKP